MAIGPTMAPSGLLPATSPPLSLIKSPKVRATPEERGAGDRWINGIQIAPEPCTLNLTADGNTSDIPYWWTCGTDPDAALGGTGKAIGTNPATVTVDSWQAWVGKQCTGLGMNDKREAEERAILLRRFEASIDGIVERELWTGQVATLAGFTDNPFLADAPAVTNLGANFGFVTALAELEQRLAQSISLGQRFIHAQPRLVTAWKSRGLVHLSPDRSYLLTDLGTIVVPGGGYPGTDPNGIAASYSHTYAYGTGQIKVFIGEATVTMVDSSTVTRTTNLVSLRAEAPVAIIFNPCALVTAGVNLCDEYCGGGS